VFASAYHGLQVALSPLLNELTVCKLRSFRAKFNGRAN